MLPFGYSPAAFVVQPSMGTASRAAAVCAPVRSFPMPGGLPLFSTVTGRCLDARSSHIYAAARSPHDTTSDRPIPQSSSAKKVVRHCEFSEKFGILEKIRVSNF
jgi:hypothetical protein